MANYHSFSPNVVESNQVDYYETIELVSGDNQPELNIILKDSNTTLSTVCAVCMVSIVIPTSQSPLDVPSLRWI